MGACAQEHGDEAHDVLKWDRDSEGTEIMAVLSGEVWSDGPWRVNKAWGGCKPPLELYLTEDGDLYCSMTADLGLHADKNDHIGLLERRCSEIGAAFVYLSLSTDNPQTPWWQFYVRVVDLSASVHRLYQWALATSVELTYPHPVEEGTPALVIELLRSGLAHNLAGRRESAWLEVKSQRYETLVKEVPKSFRRAQQIELAQDVARFANSSEGGVLLIGFPEVDGLLPSPTPVPFDEQHLKSYQDTVQHFVYPLVEGLRMEMHPDGAGRYIVSVLVPPQREQQRPFLVRGVIVGEKYEGAFIGIVRRVGEGSVAIRIEEVHALLKMGSAWDSLAPRRDGSAG